MNVLSCLAQNARRHPHKLALIYEDRTYTYAQFNQTVNRLAHGLSRLGIKKGEKVALMLKNSDYFAICFFAAAKIGAVLVPINFRLVAGEVRYILEQSDSVLIICEEELDELIEEARQGVSAIRNVITVEHPKVTGHVSIHDVFSELEYEPEVKINNADDLQIMYTSGTTGRPKGALFDHQRIQNVTIAMLGTLGHNAQDRFLHVAPLFHAAQLNICLIPAFFVGATNVIHREFHPLEVLKAIEKHRITFFFSVPTMYNYLLQIRDGQTYDLSSIRRCGYGAAPMAAELVKKSMELFQTDQFYNLCGLTEGGPSGIILWPEEHRTKMGASGKTPLLLTEARVVTPDGNETVPGEVGELILRGETIMKEYYKKPVETAETLRNGWLHTGDLAVKDSDGYVTLVDRSKDMIISGGENVYSVEVENVLYAFPKILEAAVIGTPNSTWGETVTAVIVPKPGERIHTEELQTFCREHLAGYKIPRDVYVVNELPRNASGKLQKFKLREQYIVKNERLH